MISSPFSKKTIILSTIFSLIIAISVFIYSITDHRTKIVFCDVGQGDAAYIRIKNQIDILIDAGGDQKILQCLGKYMPFYDRTIELAILSHLQKDHYGGFANIFKRYKVETVVASSKQRLLEKIKFKAIKVVEVSAGKKFEIDQNKFIFYWPISPTAIDENDSSLVFLFQEKNFKALFTGDATPFVLNSILSAQMSATLTNLNILKIPHHGSKNGLTSAFLKLANPAYAVISVGKKNSYGHPSIEILEMLKAAKSKILRTDRDGDIVFKIKD